MLTDTLSGPSSPPLTTTTRYDPDGNLYQVGQPNGAATVNTDDLADQQVSSELDPALVHTATHTDQSVARYDAAGNAIAAVDQNGNTTHTAFDGDNRTLQSVAVTGTQIITTSDGFDPDANTITQTTQSYTGTGSVQTQVQTATLNAADWTIATGDNGVPTAYGYDAAGQQRTETVLGNTSPVTTTLDAQGRATALAANVGGTPLYTDTFGYNANDQPLTITLNAGASQVQELAAYDANSRLTSWHDPGPGQNVTYGYGYDAATRVTSFTAVSGTDTITHDPATGYLTADCGPQSVVRGGDHCYHWSYDGNGNLLTNIDDPGVTMSFSYQPSQPNELAQTSAPGYPNVAYSYDGNGDTTLISTTSVGTTNPVTIHTVLAYDAQGRLSTVTQLDGTVAQISYNAAGQRARYAVTSGLGQAVYSAQFSYRHGVLGQARVVSATAGGGRTSYVDTYIYYQQDGTPRRFTRQQSGTSTTYWYETDGRGNVVAVTDASGAVVDSYEYDLWGEFLPGTVHENVIQPLKYAGYWYDPALSWYWDNGRSYDPELERYLQPDGSSARSYVYANDDPVDARATSIGVNASNLPAGLGMDFSSVLPKTEGSLSLAGMTFGAGTQPHVSVDANGVDLSAGDVVIPVIVVGASAVAVVGLVPVLVGIGTVVLVGGVVLTIAGFTPYHPGLPVVPAYMRPPGTVQPSQIAGGTTVGIVNPPLVPIALYTQASQAAAAALGYDRRVKAPPFDSHHQPVYTNGKDYISPDADGHGPGVWKKYDRRGKRLGTYDAQLKRLRD